MTIFGREILDRFVRKHKDAQRPLLDWLRDAEQAAWNSIDDLKDTYPSADGVRLASGTVVTVFNIGGNKYRLTALITYAAATIRVLEMMTHAEYNKKKWKKRW